MHGERGQALVELGLALPLLLLFLLGATDLSRVVAVDLAVQGAARVAAEASSRDPAPSQSRSEAVAREDLSRTPGIDPAVLTVTLMRHRGDDVDGSCTAPPSPCYHTVRVQHTFRTTIAWPGLPRTLDLTRTRTFRQVPP